MEPDTLVADREGPVGGGPTPPSTRPKRPWWRRRWVVVVAIVLVVLLAGAGTLWVLWSGRAAGEASVDDTLARFRSEVGDDAGGGAAAGGGLTRPAEGVYLYEGEGTEHLSFLDSTQHQGPTMPATVVHDGSDCWTLTLEFNTAHRIEWRYCLRDGALYEESSVDHQSFDFVVTDAASTTHIDCGEAPAIDPTAAPGAQVEGSCRGRTDPDGGTADIVERSTFVGTEDVDVGGVPVSAYHYRVERTYSGEQSGAQRADVWYATDTGLQVKNEGRLEITSPSVVGDVTYTEDGAFTLGSLTPRR